MKTQTLVKNFIPQAVGFKSGLEVHQQLFTEHKLFCKCPAGIFSDHYDAQVLRHMRPTLSELGEYDGTALMEFKTKKEIIYRLNKQSVCTYEMDDNPPFLINEEAVDIAIEIALMFNCAIVGELHVARKQYLDGSIPAGFQRTAIIGVNGWFPFKGRKISVVQLSLEEDSCREVSDQGHLRVYTTDRLSMPLIEVVTGPELLTPEEVAEAGRVIGEIIRITGKVRRGIGSVRQDVNVSVNGGTRIEIKGVPRIPLFPDLVFFEAFRQYQLLQLRDHLHNRGISAETFECKRFFVDESLIHPAFTKVNEKGNVTGGIVLKGMRGLLAFPTGSNRTFADEIAGRVKVIACLEHRPVLLHTDDVGDRGLPSRDRDYIKSLSMMSNDDTAVIVWGSLQDVETALNEIEIRCREATQFVPSETRQRLSTGETEFERILPGPDRMYPDTDSPPLRLTNERVERIRSQMNEHPWVRKERLENLGLSPELIEKMVLSDMIDLFYEVVESSDVDAKVTAHIISDLTKYANRSARGLRILKKDAMKKLFDTVKSKKLHKEFIRLAVKQWIVSGLEDWDALADEFKSNVDYPLDIDSVTAHFIKSSKPNSKVKSAKIKFYMGKIMKAHCGLFKGGELSEKLNSLIV